MLLRCPHCDDEANIPNALSQYENVPIACHACGGFFFAPPADPDDPILRDDSPLAKSNRPSKALARQSQLPDRVAGHPSTFWRLPLRLASALALRLAFCCLAI